MIQQFIDRFTEKNGELRQAFSAKHPADYDEIVKLVVELIRNPDEYETPDPERITRIDNGSYQGTLIYVIGASGYQPSDHWYVKVGYGSCSGCDTLEGIRCYDDDPPNESQINDYCTLALHIVQGLKLMGDDIA